jgi:hypothetical protein
MAENSEDIREPLVFLLPWVRGPGLEAPAHPNGARRVTGLSAVLRGEGPDSDVLASLVDAGIADFAAGTDFFMDVELDEGNTGGSLDLRPEVPLRIRW